jgi:hypothetical protein
VSTVETEYAVRYTFPGETEEHTEPVGGEELAAELLDDLRARYGITGRYVSRIVTPWQEQQAPALPVRERLERLAYRALNGIVCDEQLPARLAELSKLPAEEAATMFEDLCEAIAARDLPWWEVKPDAEGTNRDEQADNACRARIELALHALEGGAL